MALEAELAIQAMSITSSKQNTQISQSRVAEHLNQETLRYSTSTPILNHEHVGKISERREVCHYRRKRDLNVTDIGAEAQRVSD
jgi:hypothetical protein